MEPPLDALDAAMAMRAVGTIALAWLAWFFGRTLRTGRTPLIEQIARIGIAALPSGLRRYCRRLTQAWCAWLGCAAILPWALPVPPVAAGAIVLLGSAILFVGERILRPHVFPGMQFPGLAQQARDTCTAWRSTRQAPPR
ncbi:MAG: hypothetical protein WCZ28_11175 [Burkholderiaceae bacterium]